MGRRHPNIFAVRPLDPRSRLVEKARQDGRYFSLYLDCGHVVKRRLMCAPTHAICDQCPAAGGIGGHDYGRAL